MEGGLYRAGAQTFRSNVIALRNISKRSPYSATSRLCSLSQFSPLRPTTTSRGATRTLNPQFRHFHSTPSPQSQSDFTYGLAASYSAKKKPRHDSNRDTFTYDPSSPPPAPSATPSPRPRSGQDAFFITRVGNTASFALAVCDGVGGWLDSGVDPADFSHGLCGYMAKTAEAHTPSSSSSSGPSLAARTILQSGLDSLIRDPSVRAGGSTACVGVFHQSGTINFANLGDSRWIHLRLNAVHAVSAAQTHAFNTPYQLSKIPEALRARNAAFGGDMLEDFPKDADVVDVQGRHGDVFVLATDGVWDNLAVGDVLRVVSRRMVAEGAWKVGEEGIEVGKGIGEMVSLKGGSQDGGKEKVPKKMNLQAEVAAEVAGEAKSASRNSKVDSPFAKEVQRLFPGEGYRGGKVDDICVVVAIVVDQAA